MMFNLAENPSKGGKPPKDKMFKIKEFLFKEESWDWKISLNLLVLLFLNEIIIANDKKQ